MILPGNRGSASRASRRAAPAALAASLLLLLAARPAFSQEGAPAYREQLLARAQEGRLWESRYWHLLLHYRRNLLGYFRGEADGPGFFLSPEGRANPRAELEADLAGFFDPVPEGDADSHPQCRFPERFHWLSEKLGLDPVRLPAPACAKFEDWRLRLDPGRVSLVFASAYLNNPASLYGHTFLKLDKKGAAPGTDLLAYIVNFAATIDTSNGLLYAWYGLTGGFRGTFFTIPYYLLLQTYSSVENRDLWEFPLDLTQEQIDRMVRHLWELGSTWFDYWFLDENCSYHLLSIIEIADPSLDLRARFPLWALPIDTLRQVTRNPRLVSTHRFRPSDYRRLAAAEKRLSPRDRRRAREIARGEGEGRFEELSLLPPEEQAEILDTATLYHRYRFRAGSATEEEARRLDRQILARRAGVNAAAPPLEIAEPARPEDAHETSRLTVGGGLTRRGSFEEIRFRATLHDFLSRPRAFEPGQNIEMLSAAGRFDNETREATLEHLWIFRIASLWPLDAWAIRPSWEADLGAELPREVGCARMRCLAGVVRGGLGLSVRTSLWRTELLYALAGARAEGGRGFDDHYRIGPGARGGVFLDLASRWRLLAEGRYFYSAAGDERNPWDVRVETALDLAKNWELRAYGAGGSRADEMGVSLHWYFPLLRPSRPPATAGGD